MTYAQPKCPLKRERTPVGVSDDELWQDQTHQSQKDEADVNHIVARYTETGMLPPGNRIPAQHGDVPETDFFEAACVQAEMRSSFEELALYPESEPEATDGPETPEAVPTPDPAGEMPLDGNTGDDTEVAASTSAPLPNEGT